MRFAKMPDESAALSPVGGSAAGGPVVSKSTGSSGGSSGDSSSDDTSDSEEERATRLAELQEQVGAEQVGFINRGPKKYPKRNDKRNCCSSSPSTSSSSSFFNIQAFLPFQRVA